jgi:hypothetical protein
VCTGYNEIVLSGLYWDRTLPWLIEAFVFAAQAGDVAGREALQARMASTHRAFLDYYGLSAEDVPLLRYKCSQQDATDAFLRPLAPVGACFEDVSA